MTMLADKVDAVIGIDTHRDTQEVEIADPAGKPIAVMRIGNNSAGFAQLLAAIAQVAPRPRVAVSIEGSRSYGIGLAQALAATGLRVIECEQPSLKQRHGKGKSDPIDAHLAVLAALRLDTDQLPAPRADGDREALRILLVARQEITEARTAQIGRLRALLLAGDDTDRQVARNALTQTALTALAEREPGADARREQAVRHAEIRRLALALVQARQQLKDNHAQLLPPGPLPHRSRLCRPIRHQPGPGRQRPHHPAPAQPRRRPGPQPGHPHRRTGPDAQLSPDPRLRRPAHHRSKDHPGKTARPSTASRTGRPAAAATQRPRRNRLVLAAETRSSRTPVLGWALDDLA